MANVAGPAGVGCVCEAVQQGLRPLVLRKRHHRSRTYWSLSLPISGRVSMSRLPSSPDRLGRGRTEVKELILRRADGTIEHKRAW